MPLMPDDAFPFVVSDDCDAPASDPCERADDVLIADRADDADERDDAAGCVGTDAIDDALLPRCPPLGRDAVEVAGEDETDGAEDVGGV